MFMKTIFLLFIFCLNQKISCQKLCNISGYDDKIVNKTPEVCSSFTYRNGNEICYFEKNECFQAKEKDYINNIQNKTNYTFSNNIHNNCGTAGFFEPKDEKSCTGISIVDGHCCYVNYLNKTDSTTHYSCLRTNKYKESEKYPEDINEFWKSQNIEIKEAKCKGEHIKKFYRLILSLFLILI